jgi:hypothetical protein
MIKQLPIIFEVVTTVTSDEHYNKKLKSDSELTLLCKKIIYTINTSLDSILKEREVFFVELTNHTAKYTEKRLHFIMKEQSSKLQYRTISITPYSFFIHNQKYLALKCPSIYKNYNPYPYIIVAELNTLISSKKDIKYKQMINLIETVLNEKTLKIRITDDMDILSSCPTPICQSPICQSPKYSGYNSPNLNVNVEVSKKDVKEAIRREVSKVINNGDFDFEELLQEEINKVIHTRLEELKEETQISRFNYCSIQ